MLLGNKIGAVDGNRTRLNLIDNQVPYPEDYNGIIWWRRMDSNHRAFYGPDLQSGAINLSATPPKLLHTLATLFDTVEG